MFTKACYTITMSGEKNGRGERHLKITATVGGRSVSFPTNIYVSKDQMDGETVVGHPQASGLNAMLSRLIIDLQGAEIELFRRDIDVTVQSLYALYMEKVSCATPLVDFCDHVMKYCTNRRKVTRDRYYGIIKEVDRFSPGVCLEDIDIVWLKKFERDRFARGNSEATVWSMLKAIRVMFNEAIKRDLMKPNQNPFKLYEIPEARSRTDVIMYQQIEELELAGFKRSCDRRIRDIFCFGCYTGLRWSDLKSLTSENLVRDGSVTWLKVQTQKTGSLVQIPISVIFFGNAMRILEKYDSIEDLVGSVEDNTAVNRGIKTIMDATGIGGAQHVTMHTARRSCLTALADFGVPIQTIQKIAGHSRIGTTSKYVQMSTGMILKDLEAAFDPSGSAKTIHVDLKRQVLRVSVTGHMLTVGGEVLRCHNCSFYRGYYCRLFHGKRHESDWCDSFSERLPGEPDQF